jgi:glycosyltransferase involved in cell wall biosynthesis
LKQSIIYLGYNSFLTHKRGVENVIDFQSRAQSFKSIYYIHWGAETKAYRNNSFICVSIRHCWYWPYILNTVFLRITKKNDKLIHSHNPLFSLLLFNKTDILTVHDGLYYQNKSKNKKFTFLFWIMEILLYSRCKMVHFISVFSKSQSLFGSRQNYVIIPNTSSYETKVHFESHSSSDPESKINLSVRSIEERARIDLILKLGEKMAGTSYRFLVVGKGPLLDHYQNEISKRNIKNVELLGFVDDQKLFSLYNKCEVVLVTADYGEGFGLPIIEGYLFNKPVIGSNCCAIPEVIISKDFLFDNNVESMIQTMQYAIITRNINFRGYYDLKFSNKIILADFNSLYIKFCK